MEGSDRGESNAQVCGREWETKGRSQLHGSWWLALVGRTASPTERRVQG